MTKCDLIDIHTISPITKSEYLKYLQKRIKNIIKVINLNNSILTIDTYIISWTCSSITYR